MVVPAPPARALASLRAPIANESERAVFQQRLALSFKLTFVLSFGFWVVMVVALTATGVRTATEAFQSPISRIQLATSAVALGFWFVLRQKPRSAAFLSVVDLVGMLLLCVGWDLMATCEGKLGRTELSGLLAVTYTLVMRAAIVPSTATRSVVMGALAFMPLPVLTYVMSARFPEVRSALPPVGAAIYVAVWCALGTVSVGAISAVTYGLRQQVQKAMQLGQYSLEAKIGEGGMGVVYRASHALLRRPTAIKLLAGTSGHAAARFEREVQLTAALTHPNTIAVFDYGRTPDGVFYYAMEYLEGITLAQLVEEHGPQPPARVVHVMLQICGALEEAHAFGLVHRDIKPANVMLTDRGGVKDVVKVLDFGLVKETAGVTSTLSTSSLNAVMGTPHFMAPEAILDPPNVDGRADLYALGATAYYLLTGQRVFDGANLVEICSAHLHTKPMPPSAYRDEISPSLEEVVLACLAKKREDRPADAADLMARLLACNVPAWTRDDARAWWSARSDKPAPKPARRRRGTPLGAEATVTVALDERVLRSGT